MTRSRTNKKNKTRKYKENIKKKNNNTTVVPEGVIPKYLQTIYKQYTDIHIYIYINMNQHCWLQNINIFSYLSDKSLIERQVARQFARFLQISLSSLLNNHINLFLSDNSVKKIVIYFRKESISSKGIFITFN